MNKIISKIMIIVLMIMVVINGLGTDVKAQTKYTTVEEIVYCSSSVYDSEGGLYESTLVTENDIEYHVYSINNITNEWFVILVETTNNEQYEDYILSMYELDSYIFTNNF